MNVPDWSIVATWWLAAVVAAIGLAAVVAWYFRQVARRRLRPPGFVLIAVAIHVFLVVGSFYVYLDPGRSPKSSDSSAGSSSAGGCR